jgi:hypothetical protein
MPFIISFFFGKICLRKVEKVYSDAKMLLGAKYVPQKVKKVYSDMKNSFEIVLQPSIEDKHVFSIAPDGNYSAKVAYEGFFMGCTYFSHFFGQRSG